MSAALHSAGTVGVLPLQRYGFARKFGWVFPSRKYARIFVVVRLSAPTAVIIVATFMTVLTPAPAKSSSGMFDGAYVFTMCRNVFESGLEPSYGSKPKSPYAPLAAEPAAARIPALRQAPGITIFACTDRVWCALKTETQD